MKHIVDLRKKKPKAALSHAVQPRQLPLPTSPRRRREPLRVRRRRVQIWVAVGSVCAIMVLAAGIVYTSYLPSLNVQTIDVSGASQVSASAVSAYAASVIKSSHRALLSPSNIFLYNPQTLSDALKTHFPPIQSAQVSRGELLSTTVHVALTERIPYARWCSPAEAAPPLDPPASTTQTEVRESDTSASTCYALDKSGVVFASADPNSTFATPYVFGGQLTAATGTSEIIGSTFAPGHFSGMLALLDLLAQHSFAPQGATVVSDTDFTVPLTSGFYIKASFGESADTVASNLQLVLSSDPLKDKQSQLEYIDLRFGDRVYYKLKSS